MKIRPFRFCMPFLKWVHDAQTRFCLWTFSRSEPLLHNDGT